jgi:hypothetical protein
MGRAGGMHGRDEKCVQEILVGKPESKSYSEDLGIDGRII